MNEYSEREYAMEEDIPRDEITLYISSVAENLSIFASKSLGSMDNITVQILYFGRCASNRAKRRPSQRMTAARLPTTSATPKDGLPVLDSPVVFMIPELSPRHANTEVKATAESPAKLSAEINELLNEAQSDPFLLRLPTASSSIASRGGSARSLISRENESNNTTMQILQSDQKSDRTMTATAEDKSRHNHVAGVNGGEEEDLMSYLLDDNNF